ncbi:hypothetical protein KJ870_05450 [bacterium]|nr:hypothetical protein [bacterium]MBU1434364.1 hypothetical protein [bacterium]MBU1501942.1 hypothetical protein [bacterium]MBU3939573.1 hypothetical protein [bacterium]MBU4025521.1 hypothetical protein [bacterium]
MKEKKILYKDFDSLSHSLKGTLKRLKISSKKLHEEANKIYEDSLEWSSLSDGQLSEKLLIQKGKFLRKKENDAQLHLSFSLICELSSRVLQKRPYSVQIMGALAMFRGNIIEMSTGEGKTLTASLAVIVLSWRGKPCHLITSNDYLAKRDALLLQELYEKAHVSVGYITGEMKDEERKLNYAKNVLYATSGDILADHLKDNLKVEYEEDSTKGLIDKLLNKQVARLVPPLATVIIDEADSVLADEAITPLIISMQVEDEDLSTATKEAYKIVQTMQVKEHYIKNSIYHTIELTPKGLEYINRFKERFPLSWKVEYRLKYIIRQALLAKEFYHLHKQYVIQDEKIVIVDEKTGRLMPSRSWSGGLHQAVEAKEGLELTKPTKTNIKMSFQRFFRLYGTICGMSGTLQNISKELWQIYHLHIIKIPQRVPKKIEIFEDIMVANKDEKWHRVCEEVVSIHQTKRPVLAGVRTILEADALEKKLQSRGLESRVLHALNHEEEANIVANAGEIGAITIATNMAGRGTDIHISDECNELGGLHVVVTERNESRRVDLQLFGRAGRQGQNGSVRTILSIEDELLERYMPKGLKPYLQTLLQRRLGQRFIINFYVLMQHLVEKNMSKKRIENLIKEYDFLKNISFTKNK